MRIGRRIRRIASGSLAAALLAATAVAEPEDRFGEVIEQLENGSSTEQMVASVRLYKLAEEYPNEALVRLTPLATSRNQMIRLSAIDALGRTGTAALPTLAGALDSGDERTRSLAARWLARLGPEAEPAIPGLVKLLKHRSATTRIDAIRALQSIGPAAASQSVEPLYRLLDDPEVGGEARMALFAIGPSPNQLQDLEGALQAPRPMIREMAAIHIGMRGLAAFEVRPSLEEALSDPNPDVRSAALEALSETSVGTALVRRELSTDEIVTILDRAMTSPNPAVRAEAEQELARFGGGGS